MKSRKKDKTYPDCKSQALDSDSSGNREHGVRRTSRRKQRTECSKALQVQIVTVQEDTMMSEVHGSSVISSRPRKSRRVSNQPRALKDFILKSESKPEPDVFKNLIAVEPGNAQTQKHQSVLKRKKENESRKEDNENANTSGTVARNSCATNATAKSAKRERQLAHDSDGFKEKKLKGTPKALESVAGGKDGGRKGEESCIRGSTKRKTRSRKPQKQETPECESLFHGEDPNIEKPDQVSGRRRSKRSVKSSTILKDFFTDVEEGTGRKDQSGKSLSLCLISEPVISTETKQTCRNSDVKFSKSENLEDCGEKEKNRGDPCSLVARSPCGGRQNLKHSLLLRQSEVCVSVANKISKTSKGKKPCSHRSVLNNSELNEKAQGTSDESGRKAENIMQAGLQLDKCDSPESNKSKAFHDYLDLTSKKGKQHKSKPLNRQHLYLDDSGKSANSLTSKEKESPIKGNENIQFRGNEDIQSHENEDLQSRGNEDIRSYGNDDIQLPEKEKTQSDAEKPGSAPSTSTPQSLRKRPCIPPEVWKNMLILSTKPAQGHNQANRPLFRASSSVNNNSEMKIQSSVDSNRNESVCKVSANMADTGNKRGFKVGGKSVETKRTSSKPALESPLLSPNIGENTLTPSDKSTRKKVAYLVFVEGGSKSPAAKLSNETVALNLSASSEGQNTDLAETDDSSGVGTVVEKSGKRNESDSKISTNQNAASVAALVVKALLQKGHKKSDLSPVVTANNENPTVASKIPGESVGIITSIQKIANQKEFFQKLSANKEGLIVTPHMSDISQVGTSAIQEGGYKTDFADLFTIKDKTTVASCKSDPSLGASTMVQKGETNIKSGQKISANKVGAGVVSGKPAESSEVTPGGYTTDIFLRMAADNDRFKSIRSSSENKTESVPKIQSCNDSHSHHAGTSDAAMIENGENFTELVPGCDVDPSSHNELFCIETVSKNIESKSKSVEGRFKDKPSVCIVDKAVMPKEDERTASVCGRGEIENVKTMENNSTLASKETDRLVEVLDRGEEGIKVVKSILSERLRKNVKTAEESCSSTPKESGVLDEHKKEEEKVGARAIELHTYALKKKQDGSPPARIQSETGKEVKKTTDVSSASCKSSDKSKAPGKSYQNDDKDMMKIPPFEHPDDWKQYMDVQLPENERPKKCEVCEKILKNSNALVKHMVSHTEKKPFHCDVCGRGFMYQSSLISHMLKIHSSEDTSEVAVAERKFLKCSICEKTFSRWKNLVAHKKIHVKNEERRKCTYCDKVFTSIRNLERHENTHTIYQCEACGKQCKQLANMKVHIRTHTGEKPYQCTLCERTFNHPSNLTEHMRRHNGVKPHKCDICDRTFIYASRLRVHLKTHTGEKSFICEICGKHLREKVDLNKHMLSHVKKTHKCEQCSKSFISQEKLENHLRNHPNITTFQCGICGKLGPSKSNMKIHMRIHTGEKPYQCNICLKRFISSSNLTGHMHTHTDERPYPCKVCGKTYRTSGNLTGHMRTHTGEKPHQCILCPKRYAEKSKLNNHMNFHTGARPYVCKICSKGFANPAGLSRHTRIHTGDKRYTCNVCGKKFIQVGNLTAHKRIHTGERPHKCHVCGRGFVTSSHLRVHLRLHGGLKAFRCDLCGKGFNNPSYLRRHMTIHGAELPLKCGKCGKRFILQRNLDTHLLSHYQKETGSLEVSETPEMESLQLSLVPEKQQQFKCDVCLKTFPTAYGLAVHRRLHTGIRLYQCALCRKAFETATELTFHLQTHQSDGSSKKQMREDHYVGKDSTECVKSAEHSQTTNTSFRKHKCHLCGKQFLDRNKLNAHRVLHREGALHRCNVCGKQFSLAAVLTTHMRIHNGRKPHKCSVCGKEFAQGANLRSHMTCHKGEKAYKCSKCNQSFASVSRQKAHICAFKYKCHLCGMGFEESMDLANHLRTVCAVKSHICNLCGQGFHDEQQLVEHSQSHLFATNPEENDKNIESFINQASNFLDLLAYCETIEVQTQSLNQSL